MNRDSPSQGLHYRSSNETRIVVTTTSFSCNSASGPAYRRNSFLTVDMVYRALQKYASCDVSQEAPLLG